MGGVRQRRAMAAVIIASVFILTSFAGIDIGAEGESLPYIEWKVTLRTLDPTGTPSSPQVVDLDDDGHKEILLTSGASIYALRTDGTTKWRYTIDGTATVAVAGDVNKDGKAEVIAGSEEGLIYCLNYDGAQLWTYDAGSAVRARPALADLDGDGDLEAFIGAMDGSVHAINGAGSKIWKASLGDPIKWPIIVVSVGPNRDLVIIAMGDPVWGIFNETGSKILSKVTGGSSPVDWVGAGDIDRDGYIELVLHAPDGALFSRDLREDFETWSSSFDGKASPSILMDIDSDPFIEAVVGNEYGEVQAFGHDGEADWYFSNGGSIAGISGALQPSPAILVIRTDGTLFQLDGEGTKAWEVEVGFQTSNPPVVADIDGDKEMEIVVTGTGGEVALLNTHEAIKGEWPSPHHDVRNTASMSASSDGAVPWSMEKITWYGGPDEYTIFHLMATDIHGSSEKRIAQISGWEVSGYFELRLEVHDINGQGGGVYGPFNGSAGAPPLVADLLGDSSQEIVVQTCSTVEVIRDDLTTAWVYPLMNTTYVAAGDISGDGKMEVFAGNETGRIVALWSENGTPAWEDHLGSGVRTLTVVDLETDGELEVIATTEDGILFTRSAVDGTARWASKVLDGPPQQPLAADLDGDGRTDISVGTELGSLIGYSGNGTLLWETTIPGKIVSQTAYPGDGPALDVFVATDNEKVYIIDGNDGNTVREYDTASSPWWNKECYWEAPAVYLGESEPATIAIPFHHLNYLGAEGLYQTYNTPADTVIYEDMDGDGAIEIIIADFENQYIGSLGVGPGITSPWSMPGHDPGRTYNPFMIDGRVLPDLEIYPADISFDPPLINENTTVTVTISYRNVGAASADAFNITVIEGGKTIKVLSVPSMDPFSDGEVSFQWPAIYVKNKLEVTLDAEGVVAEVHEDNNKAVRPLFQNTWPEADAGPDRRVDPDETIIFDGGLSTDTDGRIVNYTWDLGDGTVLYGMVVSHAYEASGHYTVNLTVTDEYGAFASDFAAIHVNYPPFFQDWNPRADPNINEGEDITFYVLASDPDGDPVTTEWYLDGVKVGDGPTWDLWANYTSGGDHEVKAVACDGHLEHNITWTLTITESVRLIESAAPPSPVYIPEGQSQTFAVVLSPGAIGTEVEWYIDGSRVQTGTEEFSLLARKGTQGQMELMVEVGSEDSRDFHIWNVTIGPEKEVPRIRWAYPENDEVSTNEGTPILFGLSSEGGTVQWAVDGVILMGENGGSFRFDLWEKDNYTVTVTVSSGDSSASRTWKVTVHRPPEAVITASRAMVKIGGTVDLDSTGSRPFGTGVTITKYEWSFGDGGTATGTTASHAFNKAGTYTVTLNVTDSNGQRSSASVQIVVKAEMEETPGFGVMTVVMAIAVAFMVAGGAKRKGTRRT